MASTTPWWRGPFRSRNSVGRQTETAPVVPPNEEALARARFCADLAERRRKADAFEWRDELEREVDAVRRGRPVADALHNLDLGPGEPVRGPGEPAMVGTWENAPRVQWFLCPAGSCAGRGREPDASEPRCHLENAAMPLAPPQGGH